MGSALGYALKWYLPKRYRGIVPDTIRKGDRPKCGALCRDGHSCLAATVWDKGAQPTSQRPMPNSWRVEHRAEDGGGEAAVAGKFEASPC